MIELTRLRHGESFFLNPDLFERIDSHVDTVVRLTNGNEYVVSESAAEILERIVLHRARVLAAGLTLQEAGVTASYVRHRGVLAPGDPEPMPAPDAPSVPVPEVEDAAR